MSVAALNTLIIQYGVLIAFIFCIVILLNQVLKLFLKNELVLLNA